MAQPMTAVTPERFEQAMTYEEYLASISVNQDQFTHYYDIARLTDDDRAFFGKVASRPAGPARMLVIAEAWCPDVFRGVPVFARIAEACGMTLKVVARDENPEIMDEFLLDGRARAIPVAVFYTADHRYIAHWIERPASAHAEIARLRAEFAALHPNIDMKKLASTDMQTVKTFFDSRLPQQYPGWQTETIREIRELLSNALA